MDAAPLPEPPGRYLVRLTAEERDVLADVLAVRLAVGEGVEARLIDPRGFHHRTEVLRHIATRLARSQFEFGSIPEGDPFRDDLARGRVHHTPRPPAAGGERGADAGGPGEGP